MEVPRLPPELEREIFEICAFRYSREVTTLCLVSRRVNSWVKPYLTTCVNYRPDSQFIFGYKINRDALPSSPTTSVPAAASVAPTPTALSLTTHPPPAPPFNRIGKSIRHLMISGQHLPPDLSALMLAYTPHLESLALWVNTRHSTNLGGINVLRKFHVVDVAPEDAEADGGESEVGGADDGGNDGGGEQDTKDDHENDQGADSSKGGSAKDRLKIINAPGLPPTLRRLSANFDFFSLPDILDSPAYRFRGLNITHLDLVNGLVGEDGMVSAIARLPVLTHLACVGKNSSYGGVRDALERSDGDHGNGMETGGGGGEKGPQGEVKLGDKLKVLVLVRVASIDEIGITVRERARRIKAMEKLVDGSEDPSVDGGARESNPGGVSVERSVQGLKDAYLVRLHGGSLTGDRGDDAPALTPYDMCERDERVVCVSVRRPREDWEWGAKGGLDFWKVAEREVEFRRCNPTWQAEKSEGVV